MARNIKRNVLQTKDSELAGIKTESTGQYWREPLEDADEWLEQGRRWNVKKTTPANVVSEWASGIKDKFAGTDGRSQTKPEYDDEGSWQHQDREDRSRDFRGGRSGGGTNTGLSVLIGLAGGLAATFVMTQAQNAWSQQQKAESSQIPKNDLERNSEVDEQSTVKFAQKAAHAANTDIPQENKQTAGNAVHYGFGTLMGGVYGGLSSALDDAPFGTGILFGSGLWLAPTNSCCRTWDCLSRRENVLLKNTRTRHRCTPCMGCASTQSIKSANGLPDDVRAQRVG